MKALHRFHTPWKAGAGLDRGISGSPYILGLVLGVAAYRFERPLPSARRRRAVIGGENRLPDVATSVLTTPDDVIRRGVIVVVMLKIWNGPNPWVFLSCIVVRVVGYLTCRYPRECTASDSHLKLHLSGLQIARRVRLRRRAEFGRCRDGRLAELITALTINQPEWPLAEVEAGGRGGRAAAAAPSCQRSVGQQRDDTACLWLSPAADVFLFPLGQVSQVRSGRELTFGPERSSAARGHHMTLCRLSSIALPFSVIFGPGPSSISSLRAIHTGSPTSINACPPSVGFNCYHRPQYNIG